jgi:hypothetical protein
VRVVVLSFNSGAFRLGERPDPGPGQESNGGNAKQGRWTDPGGSVNAR